MAYAHGPLASRPAGTEGLLYYATDTKTAYYCTAPGVWQSVMPLDAGGDLGGTWPTPSVTKISSDNLPVHANGGRRLACERRTFAPEGQPIVASLGTVTHQGAHVTVTIATAAGSYQSTARYEVPVRPASSTGWCRLAPTAVAPGSTTTETLVIVHAQETSGQLALRAYVLSTATTVSLTATIDAQGRDLAWAPSTAVTPGAVTTTDSWSTGGPVGPPMQAVWPPQPYDGQEINMTLGGGLLTAQRLANQWLPPTSGMRTAGPNGAAYAGLGGSHTTRTGGAYLPWAGEWELTARYVITGADTAVVQPLLGLLDGATPVACGSVQCVAGQPVAATCGPVLVTATAPLANMVVGLTAPGFSTSGSYSVPYLRAVPVRIT